MTSVPGWANACNRGEVRHLADHPALLGRAGADQVADYDEAAGDAEPHAQRLRCWQVSDRGDRGESSPHCPLSIVLMRLGIAEIDQHAIAKILGDKPGEAGDGVGDAAVICPDNLAQVFRVVAR
jgi:hypothetical protein